MRFLAYVLVGGVLLCPLVLFAAVRINEVAWMGTATSSYDEWIELYNDGDKTEQLDGWTLEDGGSLSIALSGALASHAYGVLERTNDDSAPGDAFLIYTGALSNSGKTLTLTNSNGAVEDEVVGGADWKNIGGDNSTKHTAQLTESGWITAPPTPGRANETVGDIARAAEALQSMPNTALENASTGTRARGTTSPFLNQKAEVIAIDDGTHKSSILPYVLFVAVVGLGILGIYGGKFGSKT